MQIRKLDVEHLTHADRLSAEAFGSGPAGGTPAPPPAELPPGRHRWGAFDDPHDRLVAKVAAHEYASWWRGSTVPTCGVAGVAVEAEARGGGLLHGLFDVALREAVERGAVVSTLFPTAPGIYRSLGYEVIASYDTVELPTAELSRIPAGGGLTTRRATVDDVPAVEALYATWAAAQNGPLTRTGPLFTTTPEQLLAELRISLALDADGLPVGFLSWQREQGYGPQGRLRVHDLIATSGDAYRTLWRLAGAFASVTGTVRISTSGLDPARLVLPAMTWDVVSRHPYMLRVLDVAAALSGLRVPGVSDHLDVAVRGDRLGVLDGGYALDLSPEGSVCTRTPSPAPHAATFTPQGLALAYAGAQNCANLRLLGHLTGPSTHDAVLDALLAGPPLHIRDYF